MRKMFLALAGVAAIVGASSANAAVEINPIDGPTLETFGSDTFSYNRSEDEGTGPINDVFNFVTTQNWDANSQVSSIILQGKDIDFTSIMLDTYAFVQTGFDPEAEVWELSQINLLAGPHALTIIGNITGPGGGAYAGTINVAAPVPEPATWGMMLLGFGGIGFAMRRRRKPLLQLA